MSFQLRRCQPLRLCLTTLLWPLWAGAHGAETKAMLECEPVYMPARTVWLRTVDIAYDQRQIRSVSIDGQKVYSFQVYDTWILTSQDNERIQINTASLEWTSDFRGLAMGKGRCNWAQP